VVPINAKRIFWQLGTDYKFRNLSGLGHELAVLKAWAGRLKRCGAIVTEPSVMIRAMGRLSGFVIEAAKEATFF